mgnify:CR=1 FL=1|tara:strand:- start:6602 stop:7087 length:486 start_codon:yes stop_codon:yes gene_type:complete
MVELPKKIVEDLTAGKLYSFAERPGKGLPLVAIGIYTIWNGEEFAYVGISGRGVREEDYKKDKAKGLKQRLRSHYRGGIGGDKFCVYVFERYVSKEITSFDLKKMARKELFLRELTRSFIQGNLSYRFTILDSKEHILDYEKLIKQGGIKSIGKPFLNPIN